MILRKSGPLAGWWQNPEMESIKEGMGERNVETVSINNQSFCVKSREERDSS